MAKNKRRAIKAPNQPNQQSDAVKVAFYALCGTIVSTLIGPLTLRIVEALLNSPR